MTTMTAIGPEATNGAKATIDLSRPYRVEVTLVGVSDLLFHRWNCEAVEAKANAAKGSKAKKTDDVESYVYRDEDGTIAIPGDYLCGALAVAAKFKQDPRSPRKSAMDLVKAGVVSLTLQASLGVEKWDYEHKKRVTIQRNSITRTRPAMKSGWQATFILLVTLPEYVPPDFLHALLTDAGRFVGLGDFRPSHGRFRVDHFEILGEDDE